MEQHPVPQNISGFQFKLIGDITLKQFGYLAGGLISAYIATKLPLIPGIFQWPMAAIFALLGFGLAFVPIEERPLDRWLISFFKSIYSPTQYVWQKQNLPPDILVQPVAPVATIPTAPTQKTPRVSIEEYVNALPTTTFEKRTASLVQTPTPMPKPQNIPVSPPQVVVKPTTQIEKLKVSWTQGAPPVSQNNPPVRDISSRVQVPLSGKHIDYSPKTTPSPSPKPVPTQPAQEATKSPSVYQRQARELDEKIKSLQQELSQGSLAKERLLELQQVFSQILLEKERLSSELVKLKQQMAQVNKPTVVTPTQYKTAPQDIKTSVKIISPTIAPKVGIPRLTTTANVISGIVKDTDGNLLPNLILTVKDKDEVPNRALKTNRLGQFIASIPLPDGAYVIEIEDPKAKFEFNRIEVHLTSSVLPPLEIVAISQRDKLRSQLTKELFGQNKI